MININKLFRRLSIRAKLVIAFVLLGVVPLFTAGGYGAFFSFSLLSERLLDQVKFGVTTKAGDIQNFLSNVKEDVLFLSRLPTFRQLIDLPDTANTARQSLVDRLGGEFLAFSRARKAYYQVRYIDQRGMEIVRADFDGKQSYLIPPDQMQNKEDRYYFREAIQIPPGEVYVSPMDLNIERGQVEVPDKPVVRYATPVINSHGKSKGIVIINIYASYILGQVLALRRDEGGNVFLADNEGSYLSNSERTKANGGYFSLTAADNLKNDFSQLMAGEILSGKPGALVGSGTSGKIVAFAPIFPYVGDQKEFWVIAQAYNKGEVLSSIRSFQLLIFILGSLVLAIAITIGIAAAGHFTKPILELNRGAEIVAGGNFDHSIKVETNDEIEDLAGSFNLMTHKLKEHEGQLQGAYAKLELKAREAEALYKIGTEISAFLDVDKVLYLVAEKAHELLGSDVAVLCLLDGQELVVAAARGPADAFSTGGQGTLNCLERIGPCDSSKADGEIKNCTFACHVIREDYLKAHLAVPLKTRDKVIGALCVGNRAAREFIQTDVDLLSGLASQAAIAIENARLYEEIQGLAVLKERERIAQEMHDGLAQALGALHLKATWAEQHLSPGQTPKIEAALREINKIAEGAYEEVRQSIFGLRVMASKRLGLIPALAEYLHDFSLDSGIPVEIEIQVEEAARLPLEAEVQLIWIIREALANVKKHAEARRAWVTFEREAEHARVTIADNGRGFDTARLPRRGLTGFGLQIMRERAESAGGRLNVESGPGQGTRVMVWLPLKNSRRL